jgi:hypothetical protein
MQVAADGRYYAIVAWEVNMKGGDAYKVTRIACCRVKWE